MSVDFLNSGCKEPLRNEKLFGLCDDQNSKKAYSDILDDSKWVSTVVNDEELSVVFTPIDNCIEVFKPGTKDEESTCDGMLSFLESLYLVELKNQATGGWLPQAKGQLENTIRLLNESHDLTTFRYKKAYACNKKHPNFTVIDSEERRAFFKRTNGFRLDAQTEIVIRQK